MGLTEKLFQLDTYDLLHLLQQIMLYNHHDKNRMPFHIFIQKIEIYKTFKYKKFRRIVEH